ncbi:hypothetical protein OIU85_030129 [Salix viminalis]|uniref:Uncharacterized protein n=1 Tax=Salix viminalis TaxID=40686 RepID=A0A9Q0T8E0_SALVM|nr:hypothetical protein OIU85_030129 [Salix viminalis]
MVSKWECQNILKRSRNPLAELRRLNFSCGQTKGEVAKTFSEVEGLKDELLVNENEIETKNSLVDELNAKIISLRDESSGQLNTIQEGLRSSPEKKAALDAKLRGGEGGRRRRRRRRRRSFTG